MKILYTITLINIFCCVSVFAKWAPLPLKPLVEGAESIVIAELVSVKVVDGDQHATLEVISSIKGEGAESIKVVEVLQQPLCVPHFTFPSNIGVSCLLFLNKAGEGYSVINGEFGALLITDNKVKWFTDETKWQGRNERVFTPLPEVISAIKSLK